jgi:hypothetical protein
MSSNLLFLLIICHQICQPDSHQIWETNNNTLSISSRVHKVRQKWITSIAINITYANTLIAHPIHHVTTPSWVTTMHNSVKTAAHWINIPIQKNGITSHRMPLWVIQRNRKCIMEVIAARAWSHVKVTTKAKKRIRPIQCRKERLGNVSIGYLLVSPVNSLRYHGMTRKSCTSSPIVFP